MKLFNKYKFSDKSQTLGLEVGSIGLLSLMFAIMGTFIGLISFKERDKFYTLSKVGSLLCGILAVFLISICFLGF